MSKPALSSDADTVEETLLPSESTSDMPAHLSQDEIAHAIWAVAEYLRDLGLRDPRLIALESERTVAEAQREIIETRQAGISLTEAALRITVNRLDDWLSALAAEASTGPLANPPAGVFAERLPDLFRRYPQALRQASPEVVASACDTIVSVVPEARPRLMRRRVLSLLPSSLKRARLEFARFFGLARNPGEPRGAALTSERRRWRITRWTLALLTLLSTAAGAATFARILAADGFSVIDGVLSFLFVALFVWVAFSFWMATLGLAVMMRRRGRKIPAPLATAANVDLPPSALVMPVYNEDTAKVFANIRAMARSLRDTGAAAAFDIFVLSDSTDPDVWLEEERAWARAVAELPGECRIFYRHRPKNISRKSGNIADFCRRWGTHYRYMVVLDADSVMDGTTIVEMVRRMEFDPRIGILQAPPRPVNRQSLFARMQQFAAAAYGPVFLEGFVLWSQCDGNYWGHNAIIRIHPFMDHCELPVLPGTGPLSGEILSHDFVEAALMRRAGWKVCVAHDLEGSYEECPPTIADFAQRDQRWCQGNLQHIRLLLAQRLNPISRVHFSMGAMSYLASPLWLTFLLLTLVVAFLGEAVPEPSNDRPEGVVLFAVTMALLLLPKLWGLIAFTALDPAPPVRSGKALASAGLETLASMLIAPIMMLMHTRFVVSTLLGARVKWGPQRRDDARVSWSEAVAVHYGHTLFGLAVGTLVWLWAPTPLLWLLPVLAGLVLSVPLAVLLGSIAVGQSLARRRLLTIPEETILPPILQLQHDALRETTANAAQHKVDFAAYLRNPTFLALHVGILRATSSQVPLDAAQREEIAAFLRQNNLAAAPPPLRSALLGDCEALASLHIVCRCQGER